MENEGLKCLFCGGDLIWDSDTDAQERYADYEEDDAAVVSYYPCSKCGRDYEIAEPRREERETEYKEYWQNNK